MRTLILVLNFLALTLINSTEADAGGFICNDTQQKIELKQNSAGEWFLENPNLVVSFENTVDVYQERWWVWNTLIEQAQIRFPYMPESIMVYHLMRSKKLYLDGFKKLDQPTNADYIKLPKMYCKALLKAINEWSK